MDKKENVQLTKATIEDKPIIRNLLQFYRYDFSEFNQDDIQDDGLYPEYPTWMNIGTILLTGILT